MKHDYKKGAAVPYRLFRVNKNALQGLDAICSLDKTQQNQSINKGYRTLSPYERYTGSIGDDFPNTSLSSDSEMFM